jgi:molybdopterin-guanine dinucleotide biosynthesis protein A
MDAIILAGGRSGPEDPLFDLTRGGFKSLLPIAGKPMVQWILDALGQSSLIEQIVLVGLPENTPLHSEKPLTITPDQGSIIQNIKAGAEALLQLQRSPDAYALAISADIPAITSECIEWLAHTVAQSQQDLFYCVVERKVMEARFPGSRRSYINLKGVEVCGGDMNAVRLGEAVREHELVEQLTASRKNALKQASIIGFGILLKLLMRQLSLEEAEKRITRRLGINGRVIVNPYAEIGMDVDKPFQYEIIEKELLKRSDPTV